MKRYQLELKWGIIFSVAGIVWIGAERIFGLHSTHIDKHPMYTNLFFFIAILIIILALLEKRKSLGGYMTWKEGFLSSVLIGVVVLIFAPLSQMIIHYLISPEYFQNAIQYSVENKLATEEEAQGYFNLKSYIMQSIITPVPAAAITGGLASLFIKRNRP